MAIRKASIHITLTHDQMVHLLILSGRTEIVRLDGHRLVLHGCKHHQKFGTPGIENGDTHLLECDVDFDNYPGQAIIHVKSHDGKGTVYQGVAEIEYELGDMSE